MQMSGVTVYAFVEGFSDRNIYSRMVDAECYADGIKYTVVAAEELGADGGGGKSTLLEFFEFLRSRGALIETFDGRAKLAVFFLDKDIDDFTRTKRRSPHVIYTETYDIESYYFIHGDLPLATAVASGLDIESMRPVISNQERWRRRAADAWKEWVKLCVVSRMLASNAGPYYGRAESQINDGPGGTTSNEQAERHRVTLRGRSGLTDEEFEKEFERFSTRVDVLYSDGRHDMVFKGAWYTPFAVADILLAAGGRRVATQGLHHTLIQCLQQSLDVDSEWTGHFREALNRLMIKAAVRGPAP